MNRAGLPSSARRIVCLHCLYASLWSKRLLETVMPRFLRSLFGQVLVALVAGVLLGFLVPQTAVQLKPLGDGFIKLIKMIIPLIVFCVEAVAQRLELHRGLR